MILQCIAVDDEPLSLSKTESFIKQVPYLNLLEKFSSAIDALNFVKNNKVDLIFLDIQMDNLTGIQFLEVLNPHPQIIFTTAYDQYALKGYELDICDYLLKPYSFERFLKAVEKAHQIATQRTVDNEINKNTRFIFVKTNSKYEKIEFNEILYIESKGDYLLITTPTRKVMTLMTLKNIEELLPSGLFLRVHKSFIVSIDKIRSAEYARIHIENYIIPVGDAYRESFRQALSL
jgi:DNA-binding LytR/AlgR family response regulator